MPCRHPHPLPLDSIEVKPIAVVATDNQETSNELQLADIPKSPPKPSIEVSPPVANVLSINLTSPPAVYGLIPQAPASPVVLLDPTHLSPQAADALHTPDSPTTSLISSLRLQLQLSSDQSYALNSKLVASISKHAELEDQVFNLTTTHEDLKTRHDSLSTRATALDEELAVIKQRHADADGRLGELTSRHEELSVRAGELEKAKMQFEESMNTGLLVERTAIRDEMQKLAQGLVEEERKRGSGRGG